jgi:hypothetical protein
MDLRVRARVHARRELAARGYGAVFEQLRDVLYQHDPLLLGTGGNASDEYGSPMSTILPRLEDCSALEQIGFVLEQEMAKHYPYADFTKTDWAKMASDIQRIWLEFKAMRTRLDNI